MKRMRLSTLMLLIVIAALSIALVVRQWRDALDKARLQAKLAEVIARAAAEERKLMNAQKTNPGATKQAGGSGNTR